MLSSFSMELQSNGNIAVVNHLNGEYPDEVNSIVTSSHPQIEDGGKDSTFFCVDFISTVTSDGVSRTSRIDLYLNMKQVAQIRDAANKALAEHAALLGGLTHEIIVQG